MHVKCRHTLTSNVINKCSSAMFYKAYHDLKLKRAKAKIKPTTTMMILGVSNLLSVIDSSEMSLKHTLSVSQFLTVKYLRKNNVYTHSTLTREFSNYQFTQELKSGIIHRSNRSV